MKIARVHQRPYRLSFSRPLITGHGVLSHREGRLLILEDGSGSIGIGDVCPWPGFATDDREQVFHELDTLSARRNPLDGVEFRLPTDVDGWISKTGWTAEVRAAFELALLDLLGKQAKRPIARLLSSAPVNTVPVQQLVNDAADTPLMAHAVKLKVGLDFDGDYARIEGVRARLGPETPIRLDANGAWNVERARAALDRFAPLGIELIEQPVRSVEELAELRSGSPIPIAADESVRDAASLEQLLEAEAVDWVVLKPAFLGGLMVTQRLRDAARRRGISVLLTHAMGSAVERAGALHLAAALRMETACGLGNPYGQDVGRPHRVASGLAHLSELPGHGVVVTQKTQELRV